MSKKIKKNIPQSTSASVIKMTSLFIKVCFSDNDGKLIMLQQIKDENHGQAYQAG